MAFAPHTNTDLQRGADLPMVLGSFDEVDTGNYFEFAERAGFPADFAADFDRIVYVGGQRTMTPEARLCRVLKTVAYIVVDEDADGQPVIEKWQIKGRRDFDTSWVRG